MAKRFWTRVGLGKCSSAMAFLCFVVGVPGFLFIVIGQPPREAVAPLDRLWRRFEEGI